MGAAGGWVATMGVGGMMFGVDVLGAGWNGVGVGGGTTVGWIGVGVASGAMGWVALAKYANPPLVKAHKPQRASTPRAIKTHTQAGRPFFVVGGGVAVATGLVDLGAEAGVAGPRVSVTGLTVTGTCRFC